MNWTAFALCMSLAAVAISSHSAFRLSRMLREDMFKIVNSEPED